MNELNERMVLIFSYDPDCSTILKFDSGDRHVATSRYRSPLLGNRLPLCHDFLLSRPHSFPDRCRRMVVCTVSVLLHFICKLIMGDNKERTFIMIKPDGVLRNFIGKIIQRFEDKGFKLVAMKMVWVSILCLARGFIFVLVLF